MLANVFENFRNMCPKIYELDPAEFLWAPWLVWQAALKKSIVRFFNWYRHIIIGREMYKRSNMSSMYQYAKANNKYMKDYDKNKESS